MEWKLMYVELKTGYNDDGPAWIGKAFFSKTGKSIYFNNLFLKGGTGGGTKYEINSGDAYWVSGVKKNEQDRHWAGFGKIQIDKSIVPDYLKLIEREMLPKNKFEIVELNNNPSKQTINEIENTIAD